jgi:multiple sugar transport system substrate-binding protein
MGAIGCRRTTWVHPKINEIIPYYSQMESIHKYAKTLPRIPCWHDVSKIMDNMVIQIISTQRDVEEILKEAQQKVNELTGVKK